MTIPTAFEEGVKAFEDGLPEHVNPYLRAPLPTKLNEARAWMHGWEAAEVRARRARQRLGWFLLAYLLGFFIIVTVATLAFRNNS